MAHYGTVAPRLPPTNRTFTRGIPHGLSFALCCATLCHAVILSSVSATVKASFEAIIDDTTSQSCGCSGACAKDWAQTSHDLVDSTPLRVSTPGATGSTFVRIPTTVAQIERLFADIPQGSDLVLRLGGAVARVTSTLSVPSDTLENLTADIAIDSGDAVTVEFEASDTTMALVAKRINYAFGSQVARLESGTGRLVIEGARTGNAAAQAAQWQYGLVDIQGGAALSRLGLTTGARYGAGLDERVGGGPYAKSFPSGALPANLEVSGTSSNARFWLAGKAT